MATIKNHTDLPQSKKLAEILPPESADMWYHGRYSPWGSERRYDREPSPFHSMTPNWDKSCWSLAALLNIIPQEIFDGEYIINITEGWDNRWVLTYDHFENRNHSYFRLSTGDDNLIDACVAMIEKLHELNLL